MYYQIIRNIIRQGYRQLSAADFEPLLAKFAPDIHFTFAGDHALSADFHQRDSVRQWFQRLHRLFPDFQIRADRIIVSGFPWDTHAAAHFSVQATLPDGSAYRNHGIQMLRIVWGRVVEDHLVEDSQLLANTLQGLSAQGIQEASASAIAR
jgi:ketosteroid isomerase-like protein